MCVVAVEAKETVSSMQKYGVVPAEDAARSAAQMRSKRLNKTTNNWVLGVSMDLLLGAGPWVVGFVAICAGLVSIYENVDEASETFSKFNAPVAIGAISGFAGFLLVTKQNANLANNGAIIGQFGNLTGALINICLFLKAQISSGKSVEFITLADGNGNFFQTTRIALVCSSVPYVIKYTGRGQPVDPTGLPLGQDMRLLNSYATLTTPSSGAPGMSPFAACVLLIGELVDDFQTVASDRPSEYAVLFGQLNAVTAAEGAIGGTTGYSQPYLMKWLLYILYILYLLLLAVTDLVPNNRWNALWIGAILTFTTIAFYQISERYGNPMKLRSSRSGQVPIVPYACVDCEIAITSIFARPKSIFIAAAEAGISTGASFGPHSGMFKLT